MATPSEEQKQSQTLPAPQPAGDIEGDPRMTTSNEQHAGHLTTHFNNVVAFTVTKTFMFVINPDCLYWSFRPDMSVYVAMSLTTAANTAPFPVASPHISIIYNGIITVPLDTLRRTLMRVKHEIPVAVLPTNVNQYGNGSHFLLQKTCILTHICRSIRAQLMTVCNDPPFDDFHTIFVQVGQ